MKLQPLICAFTFLSLAALVTSCMAKKGSPSNAPASGDPTGGGGGGSGGTTGGPTSSVLDAAGDTVTTDNWGYLFPTTATTDGDVGGNTGGVTAGDAMCATEGACLGLTGPFFMVTSVPSTREPSSGWVLKPSTLYKRPDGTTIDTTNVSGTFNFPMAQAITATSTVAWSGMQADWTDDNVCGNWTTNVPYYQGTTGDLSLTTSGAIYGNLTSCQNTHPILCTNKLQQVLTVPAQQSWRRIFASTITKAASPGFTSYNTIANFFDAQCTSDATSKHLNNDGYGNFKALVMTSDPSGTNTRRFACTTYGCTNGTGEGVGWIMTAGTEYRREDGTTVIGTTNSGGVFDFSMTISWTGVHESYWTGANPGWAIPNNGTSVNSCAAWQTTSGSGAGNVGWGDATDSTAIADTTPATCAEQHKILCVEQSHSTSSHTSYPGYN